MTCAAGNVAPNERVCAWQLRPPGTRAEVRRWSRGGQGDQEAETDAECRRDAREDEQIAPFVDHDVDGPRQDPCWHQSDRDGTQRETECNPKKKRQHDRGGVGAGAQYGSLRSGLKLAVGRTGRRTTRQQDCRCLACAHALADDALAVVLDRRRLEHRSGWGRWRRRRRWRRIGLRGRWWWRRRRRRRRQRRGRRGGRGRIGIGMVVVARVAACDPPANAYVKKKPTRPRQASSASRRRRRSEE